MSLTRTMMRVATIKALAGATLAGDAVFDSAIDPIDQRISVEARPLIVVYTDDEEGEPAGRADLLQGDRVELVIECVVAGRVTIEVQNDDGTTTPAVQISLPTTDAGLEITLDLIEAQVIRTLLSAPAPWAVTWRSLAPRVHKHLSRRGASAEQGNRFAVRQLVLTCGLLMDPDRGGEVTEASAFGRALARMEADPELIQIATVIRAEAEGQPLADWRRAAARLGVDLTVISALGLGPPVGLIDPVPLVQVDLSDEEEA